MEFQKDNLVDVDFETMQQLVEEESRKTKATADQSSSTYKNDQDLKSKEKSRDQSKRDRSRDKNDRDRDEKKKKRDRSRDRSRDRHRKRSRSHGRGSRSHGKSRRSRSRDHKRRSHSRSRSRDRRTRDSEKKENIVIEKTIEEARRQALEAQRDDCTVLVYRLNFNATEKDVFNFFVRAGIGRLIDIKIIRDPRTGKSKGVAYVEFESQESILLAVALSGQPIRGQAVAIQQSQAEKNRAAAAAKYKKQMIKEQQRMNSMKTTPGQDIDAPMKIFVGGLTEHLADITESDIRNIFPFGEIDYIDMHKDPNTGKSRGYCFIQFRKGSQARAAISAMNGFEYMGKILKVGPAEDANKHGNEMLLPSAEDDEGNTAVLHNIQSRQTLMQKLNKDNMVMPTYFPGSAMPLPTGMTPNPLMMMPNAGMGIPPMYPGMMPPTMPMPPTGMSVGGVNANIPKVPISSCLLLSNLFDPSQVNLAQEPEFYEDTRLDVKDECSNYGEVEKIWVEENSYGNVWVKFANNNTTAAAKALEKLNGRFFASRAISASLVPETFFDNYVPK